MKSITFKKMTLIMSIIILSSTAFSCKNKETKEEEKPSEVAKNEPFFKLSLAQWSLNKAVRFEGSDPTDFAQKASELGFEGIEYVSQLYKKQLETIGMDSLLVVLKANSKKHNVENLLIMVDHEGDLATLNEEEQNKAIDNHKKWVDAAKYLGCHSIRVNAHGKGTAEEVAESAIRGLTKLSEYAEQQGINIIVENHGGYTSNGKWLANVMKTVGKSNCGTLPDFGNFCQTEGYGSINDENCKDPYDIYKGVAELMPYAKAVSAKSYDFDENGNQPKIDYKKLLKIVKDAGYTGFIGVEYEGDNLGEEEGINATKELLLNAAKEIS